MNQNPQFPLGKRIFRLALGLSFVVGLILLLMARPIPPGIAGEVLTHNLDEDIEATALIYMDLERMQQIERHLPAVFEDR